MPHDPTHHLFQGTDACVSYWEWGSPDGQPILLIHATGFHARVWDETVARLPQHHRIIAVDMRGHGQSEKKGLLLDWSIPPKDIGELVTHLGLTNAIGVGHSMGALVALDCAARHGGLVSRLALLGVAPKMPVHPDLLAAAAADDPKAIDLICDWGHGPTGHLGGHRAPGLWMLGGAGQLLAASRPGALSRDLVNCNAYLEAVERAAAVACPTLLLLGERDKMTPARAGRKLAESIADAEVVVLPGTGHMMMLERPDETLDALKAFVAA